MKTFVLLPLILIALAQAQDLAPGEGKAVTEKVCGGCHGADVVTTYHNSRDDWQAIVDDMKGRGAEGSAGDFDTIVTYLTKHYGPEPLHSQTGGRPQNGTVERAKVHGKSLEGNLEGDSPDRDVSIYLPPSYATDPNRRYPVIYLLHGYTDSDDRWFGRIQHFINVPAIADKVFSGGGARDMIIVMPNAYTAFKGSMYSSSVTTGDWESYVTRDLVSYIDSHYRTIANPASRGLAGHSMGGYGTIRIGMKHPGVFSSLYILSPCCMTAAQGSPKAEAVHSMEEVAKADFGTAAALASAAAWSPDPKNPPFFIDLPTKDGKPEPEVLAKWAANAPLAMIDQYIPNLKSYHAIAVDAGDMDTGIAATVRTLDQILTSYGIAHQFEIYGGNHVNHVADRVEMKMLPFFSNNLVFEAGQK